MQLELYKIEWGVERCPLVFKNLNFVPWLESSMKLLKNVEKIGCRTSGGVK